MTVALRALASPHRAPHPRLGQVGSNAHDFGTEGQRFRSSDCCAWCGALLPQRSRPHQRGVWRVGTPVPSGGKPGERVTATRASVTLRGARLCATAAAHTPADHSFRRVRMATRVSVGALAPRAPPRPPGRPSGAQERGRRQGRGSVRVSGTQGSPFLGPCGGIAGRTVWAEDSDSTIVARHGWPRSRPRSSRARELLAMACHRQDGGE